MQRSLIKILIYSLLFISFDASLSAMIITVTSSADSGPNSLRQAIIDANSGDTILFNVPGNTILLTTNPIIIDKQLTISGPNQSGDPIIIDGQNQVNIGFEITASSIIRNLTFSNFLGANGASGNPAENGEDAIGIFIDNTSNCIIDTVTFSGTFTGGNGSNGIIPPAPVPGGAGGLAAAIRILNGTNNLIFGCTINGIYLGGNGGIGSPNVGAAAAGNGGNGGRAGGIIIDGPGINEMSTNVINMISLTGGDGGNGGAIGGGDVASGGNGGNGGKAAGIIIDESTSNNRTFGNTVQVASVGGAGGIGGNGNPAGGNGGNGGDAANFIIDNASNNNETIQNTFPLGIFTAGDPGTGGAGTPVGVAGSAGIIANILVANNSVGNFILTNSIAGTSLILGIELFNDGNNEQPAPVLALNEATITQFCPTTREMFVAGSLPATVDGADYLIQFFSNGTDAEINQGLTFIGEITIQGNGGTVDFNDSFNVPVSIVIAPGDNISATATLGGLFTPSDTSEFSNIAQVVFLDPAIAVPLELTTCQNTPITGTLATDPAFAIVSGPSNGIITNFNANTGAFTYTPNPGFVGVDSFQFIAGANTQCPSLPAIVTITVVPAIMAKNRRFEMCSNRKLIINALSGLLENTVIDPLNQPIIIELVAAPSFGTIVLNSDGSFVYTPIVNFVGQDAFAFRIVPGPNSPCGPSNEATVTIQIRQCCSLPAVF